MTTRVKIEVSQEHNPVEVITYGKDADGIWTENGVRTILSRAGDVFELYVRAGQMLEVREVQ